MKSPARRFFSKTTKLKPLVILLLISTFACDSTEPDQGPGEEELITKVTLTLSLAGAQDIVVSASDPDGDGTDFVIDDLNLAPSTSYSGMISLVDSLNNEDITEEVEEEADEHQLHYLPSAGLNLTVAATDQDTNGLPIGLEFTLNTGAISQGDLRVVLSHYDDVVKDGTTLSDESDVDISFPVTVGTIVP